MAGTTDGGSTGSTGSTGGTGSTKPVAQRLLATATRLFAERGYDRTSVQEIVEAAGVTKGALYHYFGSKDDLLHEVYGRVLRLQQERLDHFADADAPVERRLRDAAADVVVTTIENLDDTKIFFRSMHHLSPEKDKQVRAERRRYHERFRALVEEGQRTGVFSSATPADLVVDYHFGSVHHLGTWYRENGPLTPSRSPTTSPIYCCGRCGRESPGRRAQFSQDLHHWLNSSPPAASSASSRSGAPAESTPGRRTPLGSRPWAAVSCRSTSCGVRQPWSDVGGGRRW